MEYYFLDKVGILISSQKNDEETLLRLLNEAFLNHGEDMLSFLQHHDINLCFTFAPPKFKYKFEAKGNKIITTYRND